MTPDQFQSEAVRWIGAIAAVSAVALAALSVVAVKAAEAIKTIREQLKGHQASITAIALATPPPPVPVPNDHPVLQNPTSQIPKHET